MNTKIILSIVIFFAAAAFAQVDRSKMPEPKAAPVIELSGYSSFTLSNGLKVIVVENHKLPRVAFSLLIDRDPVLEKESAGYINAAGTLLRTGTKNRTKDQIDEEIDFIGGSLSASSSGAFAASLTKHTDKLLELFSDIIINAEFTQTELEKIKLRMLSSIARSKDDPNAIAGRVANAVRFGMDHPYGENITEESVNNITLEKTKEFYDTFFRPNISYMAVVGDITESEIRPKLEKFFGNWERKDVPEFKYDAPIPPEETKVIFVERANSIQSVIHVTYPVDIKIGGRGEFSAITMNTILGGSSFRLFENLREKRSFTYGAYSSLQRDELIGRFTASTEVRNQVTDSAVAEILSEMRRIRDEKVTEDELTRAKNYLSGSFAISLERPQTIAQFALNIERFNLPEDYYANYLQKIALVTAEHISQAAKIYIRPDNAYIVVVGSKEQTADKLSQFGEILYYDIYGKPVDAPEENTEGLTGEEIIENYIRAIGGRENLEKLKDRTTVLSGTIQGMEVVMKSYQQVPDKLRQEIHAGGMEQVIIFDGQKGYAVINDVSKEIEGTELEKLQIESRVNMLLEFKSSGTEMNLKGKEKVNGRDTYKVELKFSSGAVWTQFFDTESGLKLKEIKPVSIPQGTINQETFFDDYRETGGIKHPHLLTQIIGGQKVELTVSSIELNTGLNANLFIVNN